MGTRSTRPTPFVLGLTGPIACGKTTVGDILLRLGAVERIDADQIVHELMGPGTETTRRVETSFGREIVAPDGSVDRERLAEIVFADEAQLGQLQAIIHPEVLHVMGERLKQLEARKGVVVVDAVRLLQSELVDLADAIWVVTCSREVETDRLENQRGLTREQAEARLHAQPPFDDPRVTTVIENSGSREALEDKVRRAYANLPV